MVFENDGIVKIIIQLMEEGEKEVSISSLFFL